MEGGIQKERRFDSNKVAVESAAAADKVNSDGVGDVFSLQFIRGRRNAIMASS